MNEVKPGTLYLVPTPIGNLADITERAVDVLKEADIIACEDTRHTRILLDHLSIGGHVVSYHEHNKKEAGPKIIDLLKEGKSVAQVSDAGMPVISDPGADLVRLAIEAGIPIVPLPGPNAALTALVASGLDARQFAFIGFLPKITAKRKKLLQDMSRVPVTLIFYEAPHRIQQVLGEMIEVLGDRRAVLCRELTKRYEQYLRGSLSQLRADLAAQGTRGEFVILVEGAAAAVEMAASGDVDYASLVRELMEQGVDKKEAIRTVARRCGVHKRSVYQAALSL